MNARRTVPLAVVIAVAAAGCSAPAGPETPGARVGFCQGVDSEHAEGGRVDIVFARGTDVLGLVGTQVGGATSIGVAPGEVVVSVDGVEAARLMVTAGTTAYARAGAGCPAALP